MSIQKILEQLAKLEQAATAESQRPQLPADDYWAAQYTDAERFAHVLVASWPELRDELVRLQALEALITVCPKCKRRIESCYIGIVACKDCAGQADMPSGGEFDYRPDRIRP